MFKKETTDSLLFIVILYVVQCVYTSWLGWFSNFSIVELDLFVVLMVFCSYDAFFGILNVGKIVVKY